MSALKVCVLLSLLGVCLAAAQLETQKRALGEFHTVQSCVPFNVVITPGDKYQVEVKAEKPVVDAITSDVKSGVLQIGIRAVKTKENIEVTVTLPKSKLRFIQLSNTVATTFVEPGFDVPELNLSIGGGGSSLYVDGIAVNNLTLNSSGTSSLAVRGSIDSANVISSNVANTALSKVKGRVQVHVSGISKVFVEADPAFAKDVKISGSAQELGAVQYAGGQCALSATSIFPVCERAAVPSFAFRPVLWTHGIDIEGTFSCNGHSAGSAISSNVQCFGMACSQGVGAASRA
ncbi:hypothetical protein H632_c86p1 [Helicosporidium sp. ATCC 50920]|nr:hypothetical protein H632_c86p1 [Helicosporidium sp. ATCC 50920]|eukprot:KDD76852.1 hypothetical protein H632_c86p1 [Helicosporidium sp. ATCC 50920]